MDVSKYESVSEWRGDLNAQGWNISIAAGWALQKTMEVLGLSFQGALDFLVRNKKLLFANQTSFTDLTFQTILEEVTSIRKSFESSGAVPEDGEKDRREKAVIAGTIKIVLALAYFIVVSGITYACSRKRGV